VSEGDPGEVVGPSFLLAAAARGKLISDLTNRTPHDGSDSSFISQFPPFPPAGTAILRNRNGPRVGRRRTSNL